MVKIPFFYLCFSHPMRNSTLYFGMCNSTTHNATAFLMLNPHYATLHHETVDSIGPGGSLYTAYTEIVPGFMVHCSIVWTDLKLLISTCIKLGE